MGAKQKVVGGIIVAGVSMVAASPVLMSFLGVWEGNGQNVVYADKLAGGLPTVCKGVTKWTSPYPVRIGEYWSPAKCEQVERHVVVQTQRALSKCIKVPIPQGTFDALTSHAHNFGWNRTCNSATVREINKGNIKQGCYFLAQKQDGSPNWSFAGKVFYRGLYNRRLAERSELCLRDLE